MSNNIYCNITAFRYLMRLILNLQNDHLPNKAGISSSVKLPGTVKCNELPKSQNNMPLKQEPAESAVAISALKASARAQPATHRVTLVLPLMTLQAFGSPADQGPKLAPQPSPGQPQQVTGLHLLLSFT